MSLVSISGSPSEPSRSAWLLQLIERRLEGVAHSSVSVPVRVHIRNLPARALLQADVHEPLLHEALAAVAQASVVLVATPIYKAAYSGVLKAFLDLLPQDGLRDKTVLPLATGGSIAHLLAMEYALKPVLSALGARDVLDPVYATDAELPRLASGGYDVSDKLAQRLDRAAQQLIARLPVISTHHNIDGAAELPVWLPGTLASSTASSSARCS